MKRAMLMVIGALIAVVPFAWGMVGNTTSDPTGARADPDPGADRDADQRPER